MYEGSDVLGSNSTIHLQRSEEALDELEEEEEEEPETLELETEDTLLELTELAETELLELELGSSQHLQGLPNFKFLYS